MEREESNSCVAAADGIDLGRISLRPFDLSDVDDFMLWAGDEKVSRFCSWEANFSKENGLELLKKWIFYHPWCKSICLDDKSIGEIMVTGNSGGDRCRAEIGYALGSDYWNKGIVTHVVKMVANAIFWEWPHLERLEALVDVANVASQRVLEKADFEREGVLKKYYILKGRTRDMVMYSFIPNHES
ncbi:hypothetical protein TIFTF001_053055 [Ficus carica]|uniref:N-acetyltransferase domain-containing protein n=1 Tax=Ficus carica TaxID=3494 RepID=A0AA88JIJ7_FICCA|nr:hypothetical protein TIFTF001_053051 [Ficus carica]GMN73612.1 hypothetical protein TIFTF001_053052 [Ficus carica]GMN73621.1 hypothetical protein TIFTF001_053054 [Ficus carica]GMN73627.1 hypothetical protein TIFTF001_053055 [Ficus carica]